MSDKWRELKPGRIHGISQRRGTISPGLEPLISAKDELKELSHNLTRGTLRRKFYLEIEVCDGHDCLKPKGIVL